jgi:hypothetical protein
VAVVWRIRCGVMGLVRRLGQRGAASSTALGIK